MPIPAAHLAFLSPLLDEGLDLPDHAREQWLDSLSEPFPGAKALLRKMLDVEASGRAEKLLETLLKLPLSGDESGLGADPGMFEANVQIGNYRLERLLGVGGMGSVWLAEQTAPVRRFVALKLIRAGMYDENVVQRFQLERQSLALMDHPAIAKVFEAGTTAQGQPYFVMEYVPGLPITEYCDEKKLTIRERIELFIQVCEGVQHAHQKAIIHRDLKPANILIIEVDGKPAPRIIDFGVARSVTPRLTDQTQYTLFGQFIGTPGYMSPEQMDPDIQDIDTRTDVYSLGVILYLLFTGFQPFEKIGRRRPPLDEWLRQLREEEAPSLSAKLSTNRETGNTTAAARSTRLKQLVSLLRGDLDWITTKALARDRDRRYGTPSELAADLRRYLNDEGVVARPASVAYQLSKFVRRHWGAIAVVGVLIVTLAGGLIMTRREAQIAESAFERARDETRASTQVLGYLASLFDAASPDKTGSKPIDPRRLIDQGQAQIDAHFADRPLLRARMLAAVGSLYCKIGLEEPCRRDLEQALAIQSAGVGGDVDVLAQFQYQLASAYISAGRADEAIALLSKALPVLQAQRPRDDRNVAAALYELGLAYRRKREPQEEIHALERARALLQDAKGQDTLDSADTLGALAIAYSDAARLTDAVALAADRVALIKHDLGTGDARYLDALNDYAEVAWEAGRFDEAEQDWRQAIDGYVHTYGRASEKSIDAELSLADDLYRRDKLRESIAWFRRAVDDYRIAGMLDRTEYLGALGGLSQVLGLYGDYKGAEAAAHEAYTRAQRMQGRDAGPRATIGFRWGHTLAFAADPRKGLELLKPQMPGDPAAIRVRRYQGLRLLWLGDCYALLGDYPQAGASYDEAITLYRSLKQPQNVALHMVYEAKALLLNRKRRFDEAIALLRLAIAGYGGDGYLLDGPAIAAAKVELAANLLQVGQVTEAKELIAAAGPIVDRELAPTHRVHTALVRSRAAIAKKGSGGP